MHLNKLRESRFVPARLRTAALAAVMSLAVVAAGLASLASGPRGPAVAAQVPAPVNSSQVAVPTAPMGWDSWNSFASQVDYATIKAQAQALVSSGLAAAGYRYVIIDEGWWQGTRDSSGNITVNTTQWPGGMAAIASYIHSLGLKAGIYTDAGQNGCGYYHPTPAGTAAAPGTGSESHYLQDMETFQRWGFDYVKVDWCGGNAEGLNPQTTYQAISAANAQAAAVTGHPMVLSICDWGDGNPWNWGAGTGALWRTSNDIILYGAIPTTAAMLSNFDQTLHPDAQHTGYYNDPDMLTTGMNGFSTAQDQTELSLWAIAGAPLIAGNNLATMSTATAALLDNPKLIAIDQDARGLQGTQVTEDTPGLQVYNKILVGTGQRAVVLLNRTSADAPITVRWADLGLTPAAASVYNVWAGASEGSVATSYTATVPAGQAVLLTVSGTEAPGTTYTAAASGSPTFTVAASATGTELADISYANTGSTALQATMTVNSQEPTTVSFPPTASGGTVSVLLNLGKGPASNVVFSAATGTALAINGLTLSGIPGTDGTQIVGTQSGLCTDVDQNDITNGTQAYLWNCDGGQNQNFVQMPGGQLVVYGNKCLDAYNNGTANGTAVDIWDCDGGQNQLWTVNSNGTITGKQSGLCLDAYNNGTSNGTQLVLWQCNSQANQKWAQK
jgi:hypothetical protein